MGYDIPVFDAIRSRMLRDAANLDPTAPQDGDSDLFIRSSVTASAVAGLYDFLAWQARQLLPDTADPEYLEQHCALRGLTRKPATRATGTLALTGRDGAAVPVGTQCRDAAGILYQTTESAVLSGGEEDASARAACEAVTAGALPDVDDAPVTLLSAPSGVLSSARLTLAGGTDAEDDAALLARLLEYMRNPPSGGTAADYRRWAREVPRRGRRPGLPPAAGAGHGGCGHQRAGRHPRDGRAGSLPRPYRQPPARDRMGQRLRTLGPAGGHDAGPERERIGQPRRPAAGRAGRPSRRIRRAAPRRAAHPLPLPPPPCPALPVWRTWPCACRRPMSAPRPCNGAAPAA